MIIRSKAPLRIGFSGGGTDLESFSNEYGGAVFNATISMYAYCTIVPTNNGKIKIHADDNKNEIEVDSVPHLDLDGDKLILHRGVYNRIVKEFNGNKALSFIMSTSNDAPVGSGLGTSSTMIVAILQAFKTWLNLDLSLYDMASLAYDIERHDLKLAGGKQDQYTAVFGGFNFMEFNTDGSVSVHSLCLPSNVINELECSLLLYYSGKSRKSADQQLKLAKSIIENQISSAKENKNTTISALNKLKENAYRMKDCVLSGSKDVFISILNDSWEEKKKTSDIISNISLEQTINFAFEHGAEAVKVSGAGGGGFLLLCVDPINRQRLIDAMKTLSGNVYSVRFARTGAESWVL